MWYQPNKNVSFGLDIPPVCTGQPGQGSAFCTHHAEVSEQLGIPSSLRLFLQHCGVHGDEEYSKQKSKQVERVLVKMNIDAKKARLLKDVNLDSENTPVHEQGDSTSF